MKRFLKFPTPYTVLMIVIVIAAGLTFLLPSGKYDTLSYDSVQVVLSYPEVARIDSEEITQLTCYGDDNDGRNLKVESFSWSIFLKK